MNYPENKSPMTTDESVKQTKLNYIASGLHDRANALEGLCERLHNVCDKLNGIQLNRELEELKSCKATHDTCEPDSSGLVGLLIDATERIDSAGNSFNLLINFLEKHI